MTPSEYTPALVDVLLEVLANAVPTDTMPILDWLESINYHYSTGSQTGDAFSRWHQPATSLFLELLEDPYWREAMLIAPNQAGKSLSLVFWTLHILFNLRENTIVGLPDLHGMWTGKWKDDFKPVFDHSDLSKWMPDAGAGTREGVPNHIRFRNSRSLRVMGAGAGDSQRAGATARMVNVTEAKDFGDSSGKEGNKLQQLARRMLNFQKKGTSLLLAESTVTTESNIAWKRYLEGTQSKPVFPCHSCEDYIAPEREHLVGWQTARTQKEAKEKSAFSCPICGILMDDDTREKQLRYLVVLHGGQEISKAGTITGPDPDTASLSYRFTASTNMFSSAGDIGVDEWKHKHEQMPRDKILKNREISQSLFAWPTKQDEFGIDPLDAKVLVNQVHTPGFGAVPAGTAFLTGGVDLRKTQMHWSVFAWIRRDNDANDEPMYTPRFMHWGWFDVPQTIDFGEAVLETGGRIQRMFNNGYPTWNGKTKFVSHTLCDAGFETWKVQALCDRDPLWTPSMGFGSGSLRAKNYRSPKKETNEVRRIGDGFHIAMVKDRLLVEMDANKWKAELHQLLRIKELHFSTGEEAHRLQLIKQLTAEHELVELKAGRQVVTFSDPTCPNHWLDTAYQCIAAKVTWIEIKKIIEEQQPEVIDWQPQVSGGLKT